MMTQALIGLATIVVLIGVPMWTQHVMLDHAASEIRRENLKRSDHVLRYMQDRGW